MIGKIKKFNFESLFILNTFALIVTSYFFNNFIFTGVYILFFFISIFTTKNGLKIIKEFNLLQNIRSEGPANHFKKSDTPTMGGIFMIIPFLILLLIITINLGSLKLILLLLSIFGFFITGFLDDYLSIKKKENTGLKTKEKFILQSVISIIFILLAYEKNLISPLITVSDSWGINMNIFILPVSFLVLVGISNSVNLTDGLDGLAAGCSGIVFYGLGTEIGNIVDTNIKSEGLLKGVIQVPADGNPIIMLSDHGTIGGYPKIGVVISADYDKLVQLTPGSKIKFKKVELADAETLFKLYDLETQNLISQI